MNTTPSNGDDLTNLNWVAGIPVLMDNSVSPPKTQPSERDDSVTKLKNYNKLESSSRCRLHSGRNVYSVIVDKYGNKKPNCSYTCLITMALRAAANANIGASLPVHEIYKCIETLFPFYKYAPDGWKNSVRHTLSLGTTFQKVLRNEDWQGKKGYYWEMAPGQDEAMDKEVKSFLEQKGQSWQILTGTPKYTTSSGPSNSEAHNLTPDKLFTPLTQKYKTKKSQLTTTPSEKEHEELPPEITHYSPQMQAQLKKSRTPVIPNTVLTQEVFDTTSDTPSQFVGIQTPQSDDKGAARELFGNGLSIQCRGDSDTAYLTSEVVPFSTIPAYNMYGLPTFMMGSTNPSSPILGLSPSSPDGTSPSVSSQGVPYMPVTMFPPMFLPPYCWGSHSVPHSAPMCCIHPQGFHSTQCESQEPINRKKCASTGGGKKRKRKVKNNSSKKIKLRGCSRRLQFDELKRSNSTPYDASTSPSPCIDGRHESNSEQELEPTVDDLKPQETPLIDIQGLSKDNIRELEEMVGTTTELDYLFSSGQKSLQVTPDESTPHLTLSKTDSEALDKTLTPPEMISEVPVIDSSQPDSSHAVNESRKEYPTPDGIPALNSLLTMVDASIVSLEQVLNG